VVVTPDCPADSGDDGESKTALTTFANHLGSSALLSSPSLFGTVRARPRAFRPQKQWQSNDRSEWLAYDRGTGAYVQPVSPVDVGRILLILVATNPGVRHRTAIWCLALSSSYSAASSTENFSINACAQTDKTQCLTTIIFVYYIIVYTLSDTSLVIGFGGTKKCSSALKKFQ